MSARPPVVIVGAGVIGLTTAAVVAEAGYDVTVVSADRPEDTVSAVAAAIWAPYHAEPEAWITPWAMDTFEVFAKLARTTPEAAVSMREGLVVHRAGVPPLPWPAKVPGNRAARPEELPYGAEAGTVCTVPIITMPRYLPWLEEHCTRLGVTWQWRRAEAIDDAAPGNAVVVLATGLNSQGLHTDDGLYPVRGQVVRVAGMTLERWIIDDANPAGPSYVIPRADEVVCGGTAETGATHLSPDPATQRRILQTAEQLVPALRGADSVSGAVGLRPARHLIRLDARRHGERTVIHSYGHGGSGVTVSWGVARSTLELIAKSHTESV